MLTIQIGDLRGFFADEAVHITPLASEAELLLHVHQPLRCLRSIQDKLELEPQVPSPKQGPKTHPGHGHHDYHWPFPFMAKFQGSNLFLNRLLFLRFVTGVWQ